MNPTPAIGILAPATDPLAGAVAEALAQRDAEDAPIAVRLDSDLNGAPPLTLNQSSATWGETDLQGLTTLWVRGFVYEDPVPPRTPSGADWAVWQIGHTMDEQRFSALCSLLEELERRGVAVVNPLAALRLAFMRPHLVQRLRRAGVATPAVLCTNDPEAAEGFAAEHETVVWRPATGRAAWQLCLAKQRRALFGAEKPPALLASVEAGNLVRSYAYAGEPLLSLLHSPPNAEGLEMLERVRATTLPEHARAALREAATATGQAWCEATLVVGDRACWVYDLEPDPEWGWLPSGMQGALAEALAARLAGDATAAVTVEAETWQERPSLFLRRMLRMLFEMEESKYVEG